MLSVVLLAASALTGAQAQQQNDPLTQVLQSGGAEWGDAFDAGSRGTAQLRSDTPIVSPDVISGLQLAIQRYSEVVARGGWPTVPADRPLRLGARDPAVAVMRQHLIISGDLSAGAGVSDVFDSYVDAAVKRFQTRHGLPADGIAGTTTFAAMNIPADVRLSQLQKNLQRLQAVKAPASGRFVVANIPGAQVEAVENGRVALRHIAVVGRYDRPTPELTSRVTEINFNPYWTVPASIIKKDLIPLMQREPDYLTREHIRIYNQKGAEIRPESVNWNTDEATKYRFRQDPGEWNSLGSVRMNVPSIHGTYMHDTPNKGVFNDDYRYDSSGCIRVQNVRQLIYWLVGGVPDWSPERVDQMFRSGERLDIKLKEVVPVYWVYITGWARQDGVVNFRDDIYSLDGVGPVVANSDPASMEQINSAIVGHATPPQMTGAVQQQQAAPPATTGGLPPGNAPIQVGPAPANNRQPAYGGPQQGLSVPRQTYGGPQQGYTGPQQSYAGPQQSYAAPQPVYTQPQQGYAAPPQQQGYAGPQQGYQQPSYYQQPYGAPMQLQQSVR